MFDYEKTDAAFDFGYKALGQVVYYFQQLEDELRRAVSFLIEPSWDSRAADIVVTELSFKQLVHIGFSLFPLFKVEDPAKALAEWKAVLAAALRAEEHRNKILHSTFGVSIEEEPTFQRSKTTAKFKSGMKEVGEILDEKALEKYLIEIGAVAGKVATFMGTTFPRWHLRQWTPDV